MNQSQNQSVVDMLIIGDSDVHAEQKPGCVMRGLRIS